MKHKPFDIPKRLIYEAWKSVKRAAGGPGMDGITVDSYEENLSGNLYKQAKALRKQMGDTKQHSELGNKSLILSARRTELINKEAEATGRI